MAPCLIWRTEGDSPNAVTITLTCPFGQRHRVEFDRPLFADGGGLVKLQG